MAANLSPEYKDAEAAYRKARDPEERLRWLREMLRTIPKHKGTEHLQADLKTRIKEMSEEAAGPKKGGRAALSVAVRAEGAAQIALLGPPNSGKSSLHAQLTGSNPEVGPYPFTTKRPLPGMLEHAEVQFQLVDLPPISATSMEPWMPNALVHADAALLVVDAGDPAAMDDLPAIRERLAEKHVTLVPNADEAAPAALEGASLDARLLPTLLVATKRDLMGDGAAQELAVLLELTGLPFESVLVSAKTQVGLELVGPRLFEMLHIVRVYTKAPGKPREGGRPFAVRRGATVQDVARLVHRGLASEVRSARIWGEGCFAGQQVGRDHVVADRDLIELHW